MSHQVITAYFIGYSHDICLEKVHYLLGHRLLYSLLTKRWRADMSLSSLAEGALTPFIAESKKNGRLGARDSLRSVGMSMCHSFFSSSQ